MLVSEALSYEQWYWKASDFLTYSPLMKYDFKSSFSYLIWIFTSKISLLLVCCISYCLLSFTNALFIRVTLKCSGLMVFPLLRV